MQVLKGQLLLASLALVFVSSCKTTSDSALQHDVGQWSARVPESSWAWSVLSREELEAHRFELANRPRTPVLLELENHLQQILTSIVTELKRQGNGQWHDLPIPEVFVVPEKSVDAYVFPTNLCLNFKATFPDGNHDIAKLAFDRVNRLFIDDNGSRCLGLSFASMDEATRFLDWQTRPFFSGVSDDGCFAKRHTMYSETGPLFKASFSGDCSDVNIQGARNVEQVILLRTANAIVLHSRAIESLSYEALVYLLLHELAHYTKSHINAFEGGDHFYFLADQNASTVPQSSQEALELGRRLKLAKRKAVPFLDVAGMEAGSRIHPLLILSLSQFDATEEGPLVCAGTDSYPWKFISGSDHEEMQDPLTNEEQSFLHCLRSKKFDELNAFISPQAFFNAIKRNYRHWESPHYGLPDLVIGSPSNQEEALLQWSEQLRNLESGFISEYHALVLEAEGKRLGWYTAEQEADELAVEWSSHLGIDILPGVYQAVDFFYDEEPRGGEPTQLRRSKDHAISKEACQSLIARGFLDDGGRPISVPIGDYRDDHHSPCFRVYNLFRELRDVGFVKRTRPLIQPPSDFARLQGLAREITKAAE